jgi:hypothetical protein
MLRLPLLLTLAALFAPAAHAQITRVQEKPAEAAPAAAPAHGQATAKATKGPKNKKNKKRSAELGEYTLGGKSRGGHRGHHALNQ